MNTRGTSQSSTIPEEQCHTDKSSSTLSTAGNQSKKRKKKTPKTSKQRQFEYRQRKKLKKIQSTTDVDGSSSIQPQTDFTGPLITHVDIKTEPLSTSDTEQSIAESSFIPLPIKPQKIPKTGKERMREFRQRQRNVAHNTEIAVAGSSTTDEGDIIAGTSTTEIGNVIAEPLTTDVGNVIAGSSTTGVGNVIVGSSTTDTGNSVAGLNSGMPTIYYILIDTSQDNKLLNNVPGTSMQLQQLPIITSNIGPVDSQIIESDNRNKFTYSQYDMHYSAREHFKRKFYENNFGYACSVCDRLWFKNDLKPPSQSHKKILKAIVQHENFDLNNILLCLTCKTALSKQKIPVLATYNGFKYPPKPPHLPKLDLVSERFISPCILFMQVRRLRHVHGQCGIYGQIINVPVSINNMVTSLPRDIDDDYCINVHLKLKSIHKTSKYQGLINKQVIRSWLEYLVTTPLYKHYKIKMDKSFFNNNNVLEQHFTQDEISEDIPIEDSLCAQQQTLLWNEDYYLATDSAEGNQPTSILFEKQAEELAFPEIYLGRSRTFHESMHVTPFTMATSELRRSDRRGVTPQHLLYMGVKIMRLRVRDSLTAPFKYSGKIPITREQVTSEEYINDYLEKNLFFLRSIPNSVWYWADRKRDLFAMIRQLGRPTAFLTIDANEIGWNDLLQLLYKLKNNGLDISKAAVAELSLIEKYTLINEDAVTCAIYFNKLINDILSILQNKTISPFGKYRVTSYFKRIELHHGGSPQAHILLWLDNSPNDPLGDNYQDAVSLIDTLISVSPSEASQNIKLQTHKHTFTCYKNINANKQQACRFEAPFFPSKSTVILKPMEDTAEGFHIYKKRYNDLRKNLENVEYNDFDHFYTANEITSDEDYYNIIKAGIKRPRVFYQRLPSEKWFNTFNPFILNIIKSNMDLQFISDEYSCAQYIVDYVNKTDRGISDLQRSITKIMNENPEFDVVDIAKKMNIDMLNTVELTSQEAAWYLLREPVSKSSIVVEYIPTILPAERIRILKRTDQEMEAAGIGDDIINSWKENWFDKYEKRSRKLHHITLAQFVAYYTKNSSGDYIKCQVPRIIRYRNYDIEHDPNEYMREMVTLHIPFFNEEEDVLEDNQFIQIYNNNEQLIMKRRKEFESSNIDIEKTIEICRQMCTEKEKLQDDIDLNNVANNGEAELNQAQEQCNNLNTDNNSDATRLNALENLDPLATYNHFLASDM